MFDSTSSTRRAPGPRGLDVLRWLKRISDDSFQLFVETVQQYGPVVRIPFRPGRALFLCSSPDAAKHVLQDNHRNYKKSLSYRFVEPVVGKGLLTSEGDLWLRQRRLVAPMFHRDRVRSYEETMIETTRQLLDDWDRRDPDEAFDISADMSQVTLSVAGKLLFNRDIGRESDWIGESMLLLFRDINQRLSSPLTTLPRKIPTPQNRRVAEAIEQLEDLVYGLIEERRGSEEDYDDLLSTFMLAEDADDGQRMSDEQVRDEVMTFILAGHETTSNHLTWTLYLLSKHPSIRRRLEEAVDDAISGEMPTLQEVRDIDFLDQVIDESLRLYPPAWAVEREPIEDDEIEGFHIPAGSIVGIGPYFVHHNPEVWDNPEGFDPDRFGPDADIPDHRYAHFPFGGGPRMCVGADFAIMEAKLILAAIVHRFRLDLEPGHPVVPEGTVTLYPKQGIEMTLHQRKSRASSM